jgi:uncharacterized protein YlxP (DUF503 family)
MIVAVLRLEINLTPTAASRDASRQVRAIIDKLHRHFNVSVAASDGRDEVVLTVAVAARTRRDGRETLERVADAVAAHPRAEVLRRTITEV